MSPTAVRNRNGTSLIAVIYNRSQGSDIRTGRGDGLASSNAVVVVEGRREERV